MGLSQDQQPDLGEIISHSSLTKVTSGHLLSFFTFLQVSISTWKGIRVLWWKTLNVSSRKQCLLGQSSSMDQGQGGEWCEREGPLQRHHMSKLWLGIRREKRTMKAENVTDNGNTSQTNFLTKMSVKLCRRMSLFSGVLSYKFKGKLQLHENVCNLPLNGSAR